MPAATIIPFALPLPPVLPTIEGNVDYRDFRDQLLRIDGLLVQSGAGNPNARGGPPTLAGPAKARQRQGPTKPPVPCPARLALQHRPASCSKRTTAALPPAWPTAPSCSSSAASAKWTAWSCPAKAPSNATSPGGRRPRCGPLIHQLLVQGAQAPERLDLAEPLDLASAFLDSTCLCANIHYPVDWVLLRDATRTLMGSVRLIRDQGLKHRMEEPESVPQPHQRAVHQNDPCLAAPGSGPEPAPAQTNPPPNGPPGRHRPQPRPPLPAVARRPVGANRLDPPPSRASARAGWTRSWSNCPRPANRPASAS